MESCKHLPGVREIQIQHPVFTPFLYAYWNLIAWQPQQALVAWQAEHWTNFQRTRIGLRELRVRKLMSNSCYAMIPTDLPRASARGSFSPAKIGFSHKS